MKVLILDNYDSFTYNLLHYLKPLVDEVVVQRNDEVELDEVAHFDAIVLSPGPGLPSEAGLMPQLISRYISSKAFLGVCLGHQAIAEHFGACLKNLDIVKHGIPSRCKIEMRNPLFEGLPSDIQIGHYHSWVVESDGFPEELEITSHNEDGHIMSFSHKEFPIHGVQFHPESILTPYGLDIIKNWVKSLKLMNNFGRLSKKINIAIDGHSACGKSTVARMLAEDLGYFYIDSGAMYRAVALFALDNGLAQEKEVDKKGLIERLHEIDITLEKQDGKVVMRLNGTDVEPLIRNMRVSSIVSPVSTIAEVRKKLVQLQREIGKEGGVVMDGRDIGSVVFPDAALKIFLTASVDERTRRRAAELRARGVELSMLEVRENLMERDLIDSQRAASPLKRTEDAILIDNTSMDVSQTLKKVRAEVDKILSKTSTSS